MLTIFSIILVSLLVVGVLYRPLYLVLRDGFGVFISGFAELGNALDSAHTAISEWWNGNFAETFSVRKLLGGILMIGAMSALVAADFNLAVMSIASLFPVEENGIQILGRWTLKSPDQLAIAVIVIELLLGFFLFELRGVTHFMPWGQPLQQRKRWQRWGLASIPGMLLLVCSLVTAGLSAWRTHEIQQIELESRQMEVYLLQAGPKSTYLPESNFDMTEVGLPGQIPQEAGFWDKLPVPLVAIVSGLVPLVTAAAGIGIYWLLLGCAALLVALLGLLPLWISQRLVRGVSLLLSATCQFLQRVLYVAALPARFVTCRWSMQRAVDEGRLLAYISESEIPSQLSPTDGDSDMNKPDVDRGDLSPADRLIPGQDIAEQVTYMRDLEEGIAEYRSQDRQRMRQAMMDPLGIDLRNGTLDRMEDEENESVQRCKNS